MRSRGRTILDKDAYRRDIDVAKLGINVHLLPPPATAPTYPAKALPLYWDLIILDRFTIKTWMPATSAGMTIQLNAIPLRPARSTPKQFDKLLNSKACVGNDAAERADPQLFVIGNDNSCIRLIAAKHHVTAGLTAKDKPHALQDSADIPAR
jgi:hypothetical protein